MATISLSPKHKKRFREWKDWIRLFTIYAKKKWSYELIPIPNAALLLNEYYWKLSEYFIRPLLDPAKDEKEHLLHYYKIISSSELTVVAVIPFRIKGINNDEEIKVINAEFAWYVAISIFTNWEINGEKIIHLDKLRKILESKELILVNKKGEKTFYPQTFTDEHIDWLKSINVAAPLPILVNSQMWRVLYLAARIDNKTL